MERIKFESLEAKTPTQRLREAYTRIDETRDEIVRLLSYYTSDKFAEHDYAHVRTDILPRLEQLYRVLTNS